MEVAVCGRCFAQRGDWTRRRGGREDAFPRHSASTTASCSFAHSFVPSRFLNGMLGRGRGKGRGKGRGRGQTQIQSKSDARYLGGAIEDTTDSSSEPLETVPPFTFKELLMLKALAKFGSIKAAAEYLYVSQSSVSSQLASLETKIKVKTKNKA